MQLFENDADRLRAAIGQYEFLRREYPGSKYRFDALFTIGEIHKDDLGDTAGARAVFGASFAKRSACHAECTMMPSAVFAMRAFKGKSRG